jgi:Family of unknown function (DUF6144)
LIEASAGGILANGSDFERTWLDKLSNNIEAHVGAQIRDTVMAGSEKLSADTPVSEVIAWTNGAMVRLKTSVSERQFHDIMTECACQFPVAGLADLRKTYAETKDLPLVHRQLQELFERSIKAYKQLSDDDLAHIQRNHWGMAGRLEGNAIYATKIPSNYHAYMKASDRVEKRFLYCHCPRIREVIKTPDADLTADYCYCGAGYYRALWEEILQRPVRVEVDASVLKGDDVCRIIVYPDL